MSLETTINQVREEDKEIVVAKASIECLREEGISYSTLVLMVSIHYESNSISIDLKCYSLMRDNVVLLMLSDPASDRGLQYNSI